MEKGFYYKSAYALVPEEFETYEDFRQYLNNATYPLQLRTVVMREDNKVPMRINVQTGICLAPYFLKGYWDEPVTLTIDDPTDVYFVDVERLTQEEYNARLRKEVETRCPGCGYFTKPLTKHPGTLNSYFTERSLDGYCPYRYEIKPSPRSFQHNLRAYVGFWNHDLAYTKSEAGRERLIANFKDWYYIRYKSVESELQGDHLAISVSYPKDFFLNVLTMAFARYLENQISEHFSLHSPTMYPVTEEEILAQLSEKNSEAFRKNCKKYGVAIAILDYDPEGEAKVEASLNEAPHRFSPYNTCHLYPLLTVGRKHYYLLCDKGEAMAALRYRTPLLSAYHATVQVFGQYGNEHRKVDFTMTPVEE